MLLSNVGSKGITALEQELWKKSFSYFEKGIQDFETIEDETNAALLLCNTGRLMRLCAQAHATTGTNLKRGEFSPEEALYYNKACILWLTFHALSKYCIIFSALLGS